jgi:hypothetical protein
MRASSLQQIIETLARPYTDVIAVLREWKMLPSASEVRETQFVIDKRIADQLREAILRIDATAPHQIVGSAIAGVLARYAHVNTEGLGRLPPYLRFEPSSGAPQLLQYLVCFFMGLPAETQHTVAVDMWVSSASGKVRITATESPVEVLVSHSENPVTVPVAFTTNENGSGILLLRPVDETSFDWFGASLL